MQPEILHLETYRPMGLLNWLGYIPGRHKMSKTLNNRPESSDLFGNHNGWQSNTEFTFRVPQTFISDSQPQAQQTPPNPYNNYDSSTSRPSGRQDAARFTGLYGRPKLRTLIAKDPWPPQVMISPETRTVSVFMDPRANATENLHRRPKHHPKKPPKKQPPSAWMMYRSAEGKQERYRGQQQVNVVKSLAGSWRALQDDERKEWEKQAREARERFRQERLQNHAHSERRTPTQISTPSSTRNAETVSEVVQEPEVPWASVIQDLFETNPGQDSNRNPFTDWFG
ncbi:predicted protein [Postia placenta Mad-698-R]|uniref:HMG box domain-containing protein n=1 Tax=Postia placenta MAD-698-R-SB12 TaxID=670580 RepID=A0A1X6MMN2_9APHY|nr:hypothetical protein POSPLADRAFT_1157041 [Postia placenta MAD-698-R-SB12]EED78986.1 predicted protein [Postia placenta Mad-698-R]OSX57496.1 hypothetical protein POSPLADRAFT_1157041 [Postia placenta MAD-698-R-SB12]